MIARETSSDAEMHTACVAAYARLAAVVRLMAAESTVSLHVGVFWIVILGQRNGSVGSSACVHSLSIGSE